VLKVDVPIAISSRALRYICLGLLIALSVLCICWELWLAPLRSGGSWLALKALPLLLLLWMSIRQASIYAYRCGTLLILSYFMEGAVRAYADPHLSARFAQLEVILSLAYFSFAIAYIRAYKSETKKP
jgi:uncharacterized membrane protein